MVAALLGFSLKRIPDTFFTSVPVFLWVKTFDLNKWWQPTRSPCTGCWGSSGSIIYTFLPTSPVCIVTIHTDYIPMALYLLQATYCPPPHPLPSTGNSTEGIVATLWGHCAGKIDLLTSVTQDRAGWTHCTMHAWHCVKHTMHYAHHTICIVCWISHRLCNMMCSVRTIFALCTICKLSSSLNRCSELEEGQIMTIMMMMIMMMMMIITLCTLCAPNTIEWTHWFVRRTNQCLGAKLAAKGRKIINKVGRIPKNIFYMRWWF